MHIFIRQKHSKCPERWPWRQDKILNHWKKRQLSSLHCNLLGLQFREKYFWKISRKKKKAETENRVFFITLTEPEHSFSKESDQSNFPRISLSSFSPTWSFYGCIHILDSSKSESKYKEIQVPNHAFFLKVFAARAQLSGEKSCLQEELVFSLCKCWPFLSSDLWTISVLLP